MSTGEAGSWRARLKFIPCTSVLIYELDQTTVQLDGAMPSMHRLLLMSTIFPSVLACVAFPSSPQDPDEDQPTLTDSACHLFCLVSTVAGAGDAVTENVPGV